MPLIEPPKDQDALKRAALEQELIEKERARLLADERAAEAWGQAMQLGEEAGEELARWRSGVAGETLYAWGLANPERAERFANELIHAHSASSGERVYAGLAYLGALATRGPLPFEAIAELSWETPGGPEHPMRNISAYAEYDEPAMLALPKELGACAREAIESFYENVDWYKYESLTEGPGEDALYERLSDWELPRSHRMEVSCERVAACVAQAFQAREIERAIGAGQEAVGETQAARAGFGVRI